MERSLWTGLLLLSVFVTVTAWGTKLPFGSDEPSCVRNPGLKTWKPLVSFRPSTQVQRDVQARGATGWKVHQIDDPTIPAEDPVNIDFYSFKVTKLPNIPGTQKRMTSKQLLERMGELLCDPSTVAEPARQVKFAPLTDKDAESWKTRKVGTVMLIDFLPRAIDLTPLKNEDFCRDLPWIGSEAVCRTIQEAAKRWATFNVNVDDGCVVLAESGSNEFRFSTIKAGSGFATGDPAIAGAHPVSGNRAFGFHGQEGDYTFYVVGSDRATTLPKGIAEEVKYVRDLVSCIKEEGFHMAELWWRGYVAAMVQFVNQNGGEARLGLCTACRMPWKEMIDQKIFDPVETRQPDWEP